MIKTSINYASVWLRFAAMLIDGFVLALPYTFVVMITGGLNNNAIHFLFTVIFLVYYVVLEKHYGRTIGKMALHVRVVSEGNKQISWGQSLGRNVLRIVDGLFVYLVGFISIMASKKKQRLGDLAAGTYVIKE